MNESGIYYTNFNKGKLYTFLYSFIHQKKFFLCWLFYVGGTKPLSNQSNSINNITGKVEWNVGGKRVLGSPTGLSIGSLGASTPSFNITTSSGKINISAAGQFGMDCGSTSLFDSGGNMKLESPRIDLN